MFISGAGFGKNGAHLQMFQDLNVALNIDELNVTLAKW